ncbi:MAG: iron ABC transporter substrate-binding protein [Sporichthyaceae bacterium]
MRRTILFATLLLTLGAGLGACSGDSPTTSASTSGSASAISSEPTSAPGGTLLIYSGRQEALIAPIIAGFEADTGIDVDVRYGDTAQLAAQLIEEGDRTDADVFFSQDGGALGALDKRDALAALPQATLDRVPAQFRADDGSWIGTSGRSRVIVYDPSQLTEEQVPDSVLDLTDPKWKGKIGIAPTNASFISFVTGMRVLKGEDVARAWLEGIKANEAQTFDNNIAVLNAAEDGLISVGLINHYYWYEQVAEEGLDAVPARLKFLSGGDPGALINVAGVGILKGSDQASAAQRFVEYLVSDSAQRVFSLTLKEYPLVDGVALPADLPALGTLDAPEINLSQLDDIEATLALFNDVGLV